jgi:magnesium transporter
MPLLAREARLDVLRREQYDDDQVGSMMSTEFCVLGEELSMTRALEEVRRQAPSKETIYYSYVLSRDGKLKGFVSLRNLIVADKALRVGDVMKTEVVSVDIDADRKEAAAKIREYDLLALPVVDKGHHMVGIITHDDAVDIIDVEHTEDIKLLAGITVTEADPHDYLSTTVWGHYRGRVAWLTILAISFLGVAWILESFRHITGPNPIVVSFFPLLLATGANVGGQASALILRELAVNALDHKAMVRVVWKELRIGLILSLTLGSVVMALTSIYSFNTKEGFDLAMCAGIAGAVGAHVVTAAVIGSMIPLLFSRIGMRPEVFSHPALNCVADTGGTVIYVAIIWAVVPYGPG